MDEQQGPEGRKKEKKAGRNPLPETDLRDSGIRVRYSSKEIAQLTQKMESVGYKEMATYIRNTSLNYKHTFKTESPNLAKALVELRKIGTNINQIAKLLNADINYVFDIQNTNLLDEIKAELKAIHAKLIE